MGILETAVDPRSRSYLAARTTMLAALADLEQALDQAREGGGERAITRHHARGKLLARERIELLADRDTPLLELSPVAGWGTDTPVGAGVVTAIGVVEHRVCVLVASDPTVRGGAVATTLAKIRRAQQIAYQNRLPMICLWELAGPEPPDQPDIHRPAGALMADFARLATAGIPTTGVFFGGPTTIADTDLVDCFDQVVTLRRHPTERPADHLAEDERDALRLTRLCVRRAGRRTGTPPDRPVVPPKHDPEDLLAVPAGQPAEILGRLLDGSELDEVQPGCGHGLCTGWGELHGHRVAVLARTPVGDTGEPGRAAGEPGRTAADADKAARFVTRAEAAAAPLLLLHADPDPGLMRAVAGVTVPLLAVRTGGAPGASAVTAAARFRFSWPGTTRDGTPALAGSGQLDDDGVIDPRDTRTVLGFSLAVCS